VQQPVVVEFFIIWDAWIPIRIVIIHWLIVIHVILLGRLVPIIVVEFLKEQVKEIWAQKDNNRNSDYI
jgi:hypothetical protein